MPLNKRIIMCQNRRLSPSFLFKLIYNNAVMKRTELINTKIKALLAVLIIYFICFAFRVLEYFVIRTDQTFFGEAFIHKLIGIGILVGAVFFFGYKFEDIGFKTGKAFYDILKGLAFGFGTFALAYGVEIIILAAQNDFKALELYVSAYSVNGNFGNRTDFIFFFICIIGNVINVVMEEGIFRGLFQKMLGDKYGFIIAAIIASLLFGVWHVMSPLRSFIDGDMSTGGFIANTLMLVGTSALVGFKFAMIGKLTGNLYMAMGDHFVNNTIVNILHVISSEEADHLMTIRITIAQSVSFTIVLIWYLIVYFKNKKAQINSDVQQ